MKTCKKIEHLFIDALENTLSSEQQLQVDTHLQHCTACAKKFAALSSAFATTQVKHPELEEEYWNRYWMQVLSQTLEEKKYSRTWQLSFGTLIKNAAAATAVLAISFIIFLVNKNMIEPKNFTEQSPFAYAVMENYLEQSKLLLMGIVNMESDDELASINFQNQRQLSQNLVVQTDALKNEMHRSSNQGMYSLLEDLEVILMQIANMEDAQGIDLIQCSVQQKSILFKINTEQMVTLEQENKSKEEI